MKEIKFRAWDERGGEKEMRDMDYIYSFFEQGGKIDDGQLIFMQFTGLKYKNGTEIYEGDLIGVNDNKDKILIAWNYTDNGHDGGDFWGYNWYWSIPIEECEIIGNIYQK